MKNINKIINLDSYDKIYEKLNSVSIENWAPDKYMRAFSRYTQNGYFEDINTALRTGCSKNIFVNEDIDALDKLFKLVPDKFKNKTPMTVYRGAYLTSDLADILQGKSKTDTFIEKAFVSTSRNRQVAQRFAMDENKIILEIELPKNTTFVEDAILPSYARSKMSGEEEVLLPRNAQFKIIGFNPKTKTAKVIYLGQQKPLEMPEVFEYSGEDILSKLNKNFLLKNEIVK